MVKHLLIALLLLSLLPACGKMRKKKVYLPSNETVEQFGDGRYEIRRTESRQSLYDNKSDRTLFQDVRNRAFLEEEDWVYLLNLKNEYGLLNTDTGTFEVFRSLNLVPEEHRDAFLKLSSR